MPPGINLLDYEAFVYRIWNVRTGKAYIGCKVVYSRLKGKRVVSDYAKYYGSSDELKDFIAEHGLEDLRREVLHVCETRRQALYMEAQEMFARDVLEARLPNGERAYWNNNILRSFFAPRSAFIDLKRTYNKRPLTCRCGSKVRFERRHSKHCSARCLKQFTESPDEKPKPKRASTRKKDDAR